MISTLKKILENKSVKNGMWMYILQFFNTIIPMFTLPYITRILGTSKYGAFSIALNLVVYMQVVVEYGFGMSATRKIALNSNKEFINRTFSGVLSSRILLLLLCVCFSGMYCILQHSNLDVCKCIGILNICILGNCLQVNWLFQGLQEMKFISIVNIIARTISVICIFAFVKEVSDLYLYCLFYSISPFLSGLIGCIIAVMRYHILFIKLSWEEVLSELKDGFYVFTTQLSSKVFGAIGITFLGIFSTDQEVGIYSAIQKITNILILCWTPISQIIYPLSSQRLQKNYKDGRKFIKKIKRVILPIFILAVTVIAIFSKIIVSIAFGNEFAQRYYWLLPLLVWVVIAIENNFLGIQILLGSGHDKEYSKCFQIGVACTILLNLLFVFLFKGDGASIAPMISEGILMVLLAFEIRKIDKKNMEKI